MQTVILNNWSNYQTPGGHLGLQGVPDESDDRWDHSKWAEGGMIHTSAIQKVIRETGRTLVRTRNTEYELGVIDPQYAAYRAMNGLSDDAVEALVDWAKDNAEFEDRVT